MSARTRTDSARGRRQASKPQDAEDTPMRKRTDMMPEYQTPARLSTSSTSERIQSAMRVSRLFSVPRRTPGRYGRATPYRTPKLSTRLRSKVTKPTTVTKTDDKMWKEHLKALLKKTMKICNLTSLANFKYTNERLRVKYEKTLRNKVIEAYPSPQIEVKFTTTSCLSRDTSCVDAVWLEVKSLVPGDTPEEDKMVVVYTAWLFRTTSVQSSNIENVNWLPLLLYTGRELIHQIVVDWLQGSFECYVTRCGMQQSDFLWFAGVWSSRSCLDASHSQEDALVEFTYSITPPTGMSNFSDPNDTGRPRVVVKLPLKDVHEIWNRIVGSTKNEVTIEDLQGYLSAINTTASVVSGIPISILRLQNLITPCIALNSSGKVRLTCQRSVTSVVQSFLDIFLQRTNSYKSEDNLQDPDLIDSIGELNINYE